MKRRHWWLAATLLAILSFIYLYAGPAAWAGPRAKRLPGTGRDNQEEEQELHPEGSSRMPCAEIMRIADRQPRQPADPGEIGRVLSQNPAWVERCMITYGRRIRKPAAVNLDAKEDVEEEWESAESDEVGHEEGGDAQQPVHGKKTPQPKRAATKVPDRYQN